MTKHRAKRQTIKELLDFQAKLKRLNEVIGMLSEAPSFDDFCQLAIQFGRSELGFDRLGLWFLDSDPHFVIGSFGIDENGQLRDERSARHETAIDDEAWTMLENKQLRAVIRNVPLHNDKTDVVGHGDFVRASLWDGEWILGWLTADNLIRQEPWTDAQIELLGLYATTLGALVTRQRNEEALRKKEETARQFQDKLKALHEVTTELSKTHSFDDLCRQVIELGRSRLGFDRLGLWLLDADPHFIIGSFGTDEHGHLRDERGLRHPLSPDDISETMLQTGEKRILLPNMPLLNDRVEVVGYGDIVRGNLWDGERILGWLNADNLLRHEPWTDYQIELLGLYAASVGHLVTRKRIEETLRSSEEGTRLFRDKLKALHEVTVELSKTRSFDDLCRSAVELGRCKLGFERLGLWFLDSDPQFMTGSFGTDEHGEIRDERMKRTIVARGEDTQELLEGRVFTATRTDVPLYNDRHEIVGRGWKAVAQIRDGDRHIGWLVTDTLFSRRPLPDHQLELLALYATSIGHLAVVRKSEEKLASEHNLFRTVIDTVPDFIYVKDAAGRYLLVNRATWTDTPNCSAESDLFGKNDYDITSHDFASRRQADDREVMQSGRIIANREEPGASKTGQPTTLLTTKAPLRDVSGQVIGVVGVSRDITDLKRIEQQALELTVARERISVLRESITSISHDLRTPLTIINSCLYLLDRITDPENQKDKLETVKHQIALLEQLIEEILLSSHLEHALIASRQPVNLNTLAAGLVQHFSATLQSKQVTITTNFHPNLPPVMGDEVELERALFNLIQNACLYTPDGGAVTIQTRVQGDKVVAEIIDTGPGISPSDLPHIFEHFFRADRARAVGKGNIGLGLAMVKRIIELHQGQVEVESVLGRGSTFRIRLPHLPPERT